MASKRRADAPERAWPSQATRVRKKVQVTLSDAARAKLEALAAAHACGTQSAVIEDFLLGQRVKTDA